MDIEFTQLHKHVSNQVSQGLSNHEHTSIVLFTGAITLDIFMAEIVALTLGGLPIAISIVEHYRDGLRTIKNYRTYHNTLTDLRTRLRIQQELYVGTLKRVLLPELSIPEAVALFPSSQDSVEMAVWRTSDIEAKLRQRLGSQYDIFMEVIGVMEARMQKLVQKLDIDIEGKVR